MREYVIYLIGAILLTGMEYIALLNDHFIFAVFFAGAGILALYRLAQINHNLFLEATNETPKDKEVKRKIKDWLGR